MTPMDHGFSHIRGLVWDLDNTLYRFNDAFVHSCNVAAAKTVCALVPGLNYDEAFALAVQSYNEHGYSAKHLIARYEMAYSDFHFAFHKSLDESLIERTARMKEGLASLALPNVLITHATREWALRVLDHLGLSAFFPPVRIIALEDIEYESKSKSRRPFAAALGILDLAPESVLTVEDQILNLKVPKEMGMTTALIHHGRVPPEKPDYVDLAFDDTLALVTALLDYSSSAPSRAPSLS